MDCHVAALLAMTNLPDGFFIHRFGGGTIADARADGTEANGVHDVSAFDFTTPITVVASYEDGVFVLRPPSIPGLQVTRRLDEHGHMIWTRPDQGGLVVTLERIGDGDGTPPNTFRRPGT